MQGLQLSLHCPTPGVLGSSSFTSTLWCSVKCSLGDVVLLSTNYMPNPFPSSSHEDGSHVFLFTQVKKVLIGDGFGLDY